MHGLPSAEGEGVAGQFPPLAGNRDLFLARDFPVKVALYGIEGAIAVKGEPYRATMPPFGHLEDQRIAAIINYIRSAWGNAALAPAGMVEVDAAAVKAARATQMTSAAVLAYRKGLQTKP